MDPQYLSEFKALTQSLLNNKERKLFQRIISSYKEDEDLEKLINSLKLIIVSNEKCQLIPFIRLFLLRKHKHFASRLTAEEFLNEDDVTHQRDGPKVIERMQNSRASMSSVGSNKRKNLLSANIVRKLNESLGIGIRGGLDFGCGIFVSDVQPDSPAARAGLRLGDQILFVNNVSFEQITANAAARFLASAFPLPNNATPNNTNSNMSRLRIVFSRTGMVPAHRSNRERMAWYDARTGSTVFGSFAVNEDSQMVHSIPISSIAESKASELEVDIDIHVTMSFAIRGGRDFGLGIYVSALGNKESNPQHIAKFVELRVGDEIVAVNGRDIRQLRHSQAVDFLRQQKHLAVTVKHLGKYPLYKEINSEITWIAATAADPTHGPTTVTQHCRTELPWETVVTVRKNEKHCVVINENKNNYAVARPPISLHQSSNQSFSFGLTNSSSGSLIVETSNLQQRSRQLVQSGGSLRSSWTTSASVNSGNCSIVSQPAKASFVFQSARGKHSLFTTRAPISKIHYEDANNPQAEYCDSASLAKFENSSKPSVMNNVDSVNEKISKTYETRNREEQITNFTQLEPVSSPEKSGAGTRPPSVAVKGQRTSLIKLPKRPDTILGLGVTGGGDSPEQCIRIDHALPNSIAGEAVNDGMIVPGCMLLAVDGHSLVGVGHDEAVGLIRRCFRDTSKPTLNLLVAT